MIIVLTNDFHHTEVTVRVPRLPYRLSSWQARRIKNTLCGLSDCTCCVVRGPRDKQARDADGEPIMISYGLNGWEVQEMEA